MCLTTSGSALQIPLLPCQLGWGVQRPFLVEEEVPNDIDTLTKIRDTGFNSPNRSSKHRRNEKEATRTRATLKGGQA
jgi:hypothetical protein